MNPSEERLRATVSYTDVCRDVRPPDRGAAMLARIDEAIRPLQQLFDDRLAAVPLRVDWTLRTTANPSRRTLTSVHGPHTSTLSDFVDTAPPGTDGWSSVSLVWDPATRHIAVTMSNLCDRVRVDLRPAGPSLGELLAAAADEQVSLDHHRHGAHGDGLAEHPFAEVLYSIGAGLLGRRDSTDECVVCDLRVLAEGADGAGLAVADDFLHAAPSGRHVSAAELVAVAAAVPADLPHAGALAAGLWDGRALDAAALAATLDAAR